MAEHFCLESLFSKRVMNSTFSRMTSSEKLNQIRLPAPVITGQIVFRRLFRMEMHSPPHRAAGYDLFRELNEYRFDAIS